MDIRVFIRKSAVYVAAIIASAGIFALVAQPSLAPPATSMVTAFTPAQPSLSLSLLPSCSSP
jgi:hypothetical protein